jgi:hypothetical protein
MQLGTFCMLVGNALLLWVAEHENWPRLFDILAASTITCLCIKLDCIQARRRP